MGSIMMNILVFIYILLEGREFGKILGLGLI